MKGSEDMLDVARRRRSIRRYEKREIPADLIAQLKEAVLRSPTYPAEQKAPVAAERLPWEKILPGT